MAKIVIAELELDIEQVLKSTSDLKKEIDRLKNTQKDLAASGQSTSQAFIQNEAVLKSLNSAYASNVKAVAESGKATATQANQTEMLNLALNQEVTSISEAREQNKLLNKLRNETNATTKEGQAQIAALNKKLDENNEFIKDNADAYLKQKINIGNYSESIKEAAQSMNPLNGGMTGFISRSQEAGGVLPLVKNGLLGVITGIRGMIGASLAFIATPIGAIIAAVAVTLGILVSVFKTFQPVVDKAEQAVAAIGSVLNVVKNTILAVVTGTKSLGEAFSGLGGAMSSAATEAANLTKAQQDLDDVMQAQEVTTAKNRAEINKLNVQLKDRTKTEKERLAISDQIIKKEQADFEQRKKVVDEEVRIARAVIANKAQFTAAERKLLKEQGIGAKELAESRGGNYDAEFEALNKARLKAIALENEVSVNIEKQYSRRNKIEDEAQANADRAAAQAEKNAEKSAAARQKAIDDAIAKQEQELRLLEEKNRFEEDAVKKAEILAQKEISILDSKLKNKKISQTEYDASKLAVENNLIELQKQKDQEELQRVKEFDARKKELQNQIDIANATTQAEKDALKLSQDLEKHLLELETIKATETEKAELKKLIIEQYNQDVLKLTQDAAIKQAEMQRDADVKELEYQKQKQEMIVGLAQQLGQALIGILGNSLAGQLAAIAFDAVIQIAKLKIATSAAQQINLANAAAISIPTGGASLVAAKATNIALGASSKLQQAGILASAAISGVGAVARKFEQGGIQEIGGKRHSAGGTKFYGEDGTMFEAERGEGIGILNRGAYAAFMDFNNQFGSGKSGGGMFAGGGIITQGVRPQSQDTSFILDAISSMPAPVVAVQEIQTVGNRYVNVVSNADF
jgi:hypothetical protein